MELTQIQQPLEWVQLKAMERRFELRAGEETLGSLEFQSAFGSLALAVWGMGRWTFKRVGFFRPRVTMRREGEQQDLAVYRPKWAGSEGVLELSGGRKYTWQAANFWASRFVLAGEDGQALATYQSGLEESHIADMFKNQARVEISPAATRLPELPLLICAGWYLILLHKEDGAAATVAATTAV